MRQVCPLLWVQIELKAASISIRFDRRRLPCFARFEVVR
jgi:hypothetical protein